MPAVENQTLFGFAEASKRWVVSYGHLASGRRIGDLKTIYLADGD